MIEQWENLTKDYIDKQFKKDSLESKILNKFLAGQNDFFEIQTNTTNWQRKKRTQFVKKILIELGSQLKYKNYANGFAKNEIDENICKGFINKEWLFDLIWYEELANQPYVITSYKLIMECEWDFKRINDKSGDKYSAMKFDFQKLILAKADLHLMVFKLRSDYEKDLEGLKEYFEESLKSFKDLDKNFNLLVIGVVDVKREKAFKILNYNPYRII